MPFEQLDFDSAVSPSFSVCMGLSSLAAEWRPFRPVGPHG